MKFLQSIKGLLLACAVLLLIIIGSLASYMGWVDDELWRQNVNLVKETTYQQAETVSLHFSTIEATLQQRREGLEKLASDDKASIERLMQSWDGKASHCFLMYEDRSIYDCGRGFDKFAIRQINMENEYSSIEPHICANCGQAVLDFYTRVNFKDGKYGYLVNEMPIKTLLARVTDNFYDNQGLSYVTDVHGHVLLRPSNVRANKTLSSFFDLLREENNTKPQIDALAESMQEKKTGDVVLYMDHQPTLIVFRPIKSSDWMLVSVIPEAAIAAETKNIITRTLLLLGIVLSAVLIAFGFVFLVENSKKKLALRDVQLSTELKASEDKNIYMAKMNAEQEAQIAEINSLNVALEDRQSRLEESSAEQEAQIAEITSLNEQLQINQSRLEEVSSEQEAQLEEISSLNKKLEEERLKADAANEAKTAFLNNMSHDIRTPMNAILGFAKLMEGQKDNPEQVENYLQKIISSGEYLLTIINNVLDMARIESGKATLDEEFFDLGDEKNNVLTVFEGEIKRKNLHVHLTSTYQHRYVFLDQTKCQQILVNIISNAIKYTPEGGSINVTFTEQTCDKPGYGTFVVRIADTGIGMSQDYLKIIFDAFTRERNTTQSKIIGTGLGMAIVKKLVDILGGTIEVSSELGKGSIFTLTFNFKIVEKPEQYLHPEVDVAHTVDFTGKRILLAEDNELNAEIAMAVLEDEGFTIEHAEDGVICVDMLNKSAAGYYDVILMDVQMPNMNGYDATKHIRALPDKAKADIPILAMTANAFEEDKQKAFAAGMNGFCSKPLNMEELLQELTKVLA